MPPGGYFSEVKEVEHMSRKEFADLGKIGDCSARSIEVRGMGVRVRRGSGVL